MDHTVLLNVIQRRQHIPWIYQPTPFLLFTRHNWNGTMQMILHYFLCANSSNRGQYSLQMGLKNISSTKSSTHVTVEKDGNSWSDGSVTHQNMTFGSLRQILQNAKCSTNGMKWVVMGQTPGSFSLEVLSIIFPRGFDAPSCLCWC